ncbi:MAG TPA: hypothetical protein VM511_00380 [Luteolibacter sp.]|nr:hypothetical protein [Luteolibacter sp.]
MRLLLFLFLTAIASAQETLIRKQFEPITDTHVEVTSLFSRPAADGYFPVRVKIANNLKTPASIRLDFRCSANYDNSLKCTSSFSFDAPPGKTVIRDIVVPQNPVGTTYGSAISILTELSGTMGMEAHSLSADYNPTQPSVLLSAPLYTPNASKLDAELTTRLSASYGGSMTFASKFTAADLPDNWLAYSGFDRILMLDSDWTTAPAGARTAIESWVRLGGDLIVYSPTNASAASLSLPENTGFGTVSTTDIKNDLTLNETETISRVMGGGMTSPRKMSLENDYHISWPLRAAFGDESFRYAVFIIILVFFGILVGPINLFVFAKSGRRHRLFITTPIISLGTSILLIILIIFQDGFGGKGMRAALIEVADNSAYIHQEQFCRTGVLTKSNFAVDPAVLFTPVQVKETSWSRFTSSNTRGTFNLQPSGGKLSATGDWFQSRSEQGHSIDGVIPTRGRIEKTSTPDKLISTFDFPIEKLYYLDPSAKWHRAESIRTGESFALTQVEDTLVNPEIQKLGAQLSARNQRFFERVRYNRGHFIAVASSGPVIATHPGIRWEETTSIITGAVVAP